MNKKTQKFLIYSLLLTLIPVLIGSQIIINNVNQSLSNIPSDIELLASDYIHKDLSEKNELNQIQDVKLYAYELESHMNLITHNMSFAVDQESSKEVILYSIEVEKYNDEYIIKGVNRFIIVNRHLLKYLILIVSFVVFCACYYSAAMCYSTSTKDKWKRSLFILSGVGTLSLNWTTSQMTFNLTSIALPAVGVAYGGDNISYTLLLHLPIGLIIYWLKWKNETKIQLEECNG